MKIRKFKKEDARRVSYFIHKNIREVLSKYQPKKVSDFFYKNMSPAGIIRKSKNTDYYLVVAKDRILGINGLRDNEIRTMFVNPRYHGKGVGKKLIDNIEKVAKKRKIRKLKVHSTPYAEKFYKKYGFKRIKKVTQKARENKNIKWLEILMEKKI
ncbi:MAG: GNAT family N-acetyltransferase [Candidatus Woesearchaeota archaeon]